MKGALIYSNESILPVAKYCKIVFHIFRNFYANRRTIIDGSISSLPSVRPKTMAIRFSDKFFPLPSRVAALWRVLRHGDRYAVKIYRGKLKYHGIIARSEAIEIPDSRPQTIEPRDRARHRLLRAVLCPSEPEYEDSRNCNRPCRLRYSAKLLIFKPRPLSTVPII